MTNELSEFIPDSMKYDRYDTYVGEGIESIVASSQYGVYGLLNEYNAYGRGEYKIKVRGYVQRNGKPLYSNWSNEITVVVK